MVNLLSKKQTQYDQILFFFSTHSDIEYTPKDIYKEFPNFAQSSIRRILKQELLKDGKLIQESYGHYNINDKKIYRKIVKMGASCGGKFKKLYALTFEYNEDPRETELIEEIEKDFPYCTYINYDYRDLTDHEGKIIDKGDDIEDFGYSQDEWDGPVKNNQFFPKIKTGEE